jgi:hypothetical protein
MTSSSQTIIQEARTDFEKMLDSGSLGFCVERPYMVVV